MGIGAFRGDVPAMRDRDLSGHATGPSTTAHGEKCAAGRTTIAATAADRLGLDAHRPPAASVDAAGIGDGDISAETGSRAAASDGGQTAAVAAGSAAAAQGLGEDAAGQIARRVQRAGIVDGHDAAIAAAAAGAAQGRQAARRGTGTAAATDGLRVDRISALAARGDDRTGTGVDRHAGAIAPGCARTPQGNNTRGKGSRAAATTDRLGMNTAGVQTRRRDAGTAS